MTDRAPTPLPPRLAALHAWVRSQAWLRRFTLLNRLLLAMAFLPTGLVKATGQRFTQLPVENPIGFFFEAMYRTGPFWTFIGVVQIAAAVLLLIPRTALLGALLFAPISLSILLITFGIGFEGTVFIAAGMALSVTYLICWDADRVWAAATPLLARGGRGGLLTGMHRVEALGWGFGAASGLGVFLVTRSFLPRSMMLPLLVGGCGAVLLVLLGWIVGALGKGRATRRPLTE